MNNEFKDYINSQTDVDAEDIEHMYSLATERKVRRGEYLLREGETCKHKIFIAKGMLRTFGLSADGSEHILNFSSENDWTLDAESFDRNIPSRYNIDAVEPCELLLWTKPDFESLQTGIPKLKKFSEQLISHNIHSSRQRLLLTLSATPEEKYEHFITSFPGLLSRLPLRMIAAYLGISLKTLNRVRHAQLLRS